MDIFNTLTLSFQNLPILGIPGGDVEHRPKVRVLCLRDNVFEPRPGRGLECSACRPDLVRNIDKKGGIEFASSFPRHGLWLSIGQIDTLTPANYFSNVFPAAPYVVVEIDTVSPQSKWVEMG